MRLTLTLFIVVIMLGISSCARHVTCPTYSDADQELKEAKVNNDLDV